MVQPSSIYIFDSICSIYIYISLYLFHDTWLEPKSFFFFFRSFQNKAACFVSELHRNHNLTYPFVTSNKSFKKSTQPVSNKAKKQMLVFNFVFHSHPFSTQLQPAPKAQFLFSGYSSHQFVPPCCVGFFGTLAAHQSRNSDKKWPAGTFTV